MKRNNPHALTLQRYIFNVIKPYQKWLVLMALCGLVWAFINTFLPYTLKLVIDHAVDYKGEKSAILSVIAPYALMYMFLWVMLCGNMRLLDWVKLKFFPSVREEAMRQMFGYLSLHSHHYFQNHFAGSLSNKIENMHCGIVSILTILDDLYAQALGLMVALAMLYWIHPVFAGILLGWVFVFLIATFLFLKPIQRRSQALAESATTVIGNIVDSISNMMNVRLFAREPDEVRYIHRSIRDAVTKDRAMQRTIIKMRILWDLSILILLSLNIYVLCVMYAKNLVSIGDFTFVMTLSISILWNLWFLAGQFVSFSEQTGRCQQALSILSQPHEIINSEDAKPLVVSQGRIEFKEVSFHYDEGRHLFRNKNIVIEGGQKVGLVGFSGSGKSTFVNLILRLYDVESGDITIDRQSVSHVIQSSLRENIALIPQDITLFHRNLMDNIRFVNLQATDEDVIAISKKAHCHEFIMQLADGYQSMVGERGVKLSGGQRQRIAIARAMLKNAPILILDEATSSLDSITEQYIQEALQDLIYNKTTIVIAHRLSTLSKMDRILVFHQGEIIEEGTHDALIQLGGHYARMWHMQAGGFLPDGEKDPAITR